MASLGSDENIHEFRMQTKLLIFISGKITIFYVCNSSCEIKLLLDKKIFLTQVNCLIEKIMN
ncbi:hypothetical protein BpHYR1_008674 [Brachionus plicatilis]|uniref:Uncharacterized protein n=1 Tax=Brachionus plicatilis TaxID=10195 RepID=A0A3M7QFV0_BRAPC|nr:hypothetical protein BpHYR1_008674 [Brachionus plicatilis]